MASVPPQSARRGLPILLVASLLAGCGAADRASADRFREGGRLIALSGGDAGAAGACFTCHGLDGRGNGAGAPRLAGMGLGYLDRQLDDYATGLRRHPEMEAFARRLPPRDRQAVSAFYAALPVAPGAMPATPAPSLYTSGDPARGLAACADCHGLRGEGVGDGNPPIGAQPAAYLAAQMHAWRSSARRNDAENVMLLISRRLDAEEIETLAAYAASLPAGPPSPGSPEASPAARRADPRNGASAQRPHEAAQ